MLFILYIVALAATSLVSAAPFKREKALEDVDILKFADVLEQLENQFYTEGLKKFDANAFASAGFVSGELVTKVLEGIKNDEKTHSTALRSAIKSLGGTPEDKCKFNFDSVLGDIPTMAATARVVENVGVGAYGGGGLLIKNKNILAAAASILPVEARHQTILNAVNNGSPIPSAFDMHLSPGEVLAIAGPFISGCDLGIKPNPSLTVTTKDIAPGKKLEFKSDAIKGNNDKLFCQMLAGGLPNTISLPLKECCVPANLDGPVLIWVTGDPQPLSANVLERAVNVTAGPTMVFSDDPKNKGGVGSLLRSDKSDKGSSGESVNTQTISPSAASSIISSASGTASSAASGTSAPSPAGKVSTPPNNSGGPNEQTGPASDGQLTVLGITKVKASDLPAGSSAAPSPSSSSSSGGGGGGYGGY